MNRLENWFCALALWRRVTQRHLLPWLTAGADLGDHVLELGAGLGAATGDLLRRAPRVTSLDYDHKFAATLKMRVHTHAGVVQGDAATLPFRDNTFSSVIAVFVLHHLRSSELQNRAFNEVGRVLRPGGVFLALEIQDGWLPRAAHFQSTFIPVIPALVAPRLARAGFSNVAVNFRAGAFAIRAIREPAPGAMLNAYSSR
jgi:ubiquinone/menaquinone biosynthesis C-methylase UbiE